MKAQRVTLGALLVVLALVVLLNWRGRTGLETVFTTAVRYEPLKIANPTLRLDVLEEARSQEYTGTHRNIFSATPPPPVQPPPRPQAEAPQVPPEPAGPPPLQVPYRFYGYATDPRTGSRRAFFTAGDDIFIVAEGGLIQGRFRVLRIGNAQAEVEEVVSGRKASLPLEMPQG